MMRILKFFLVLTLIFIVTNFSYAFKKVEYPDKSYICVPNTIDENEIKILVLFHGFVDNINSIKNKQYKDMNFDKELFNWQFKAGKENFFIVGFDLDYKSFRSETADDILHYRIEKKIAEINNEYKPLVLKKYVAGTQYGGAMAVYFNLKYDDYDACICMNGAEIIPSAKRYLDKAKGKKFYFFHGEENKYLPIHKVNRVVKQLQQHEGITYLKSYPKLSYFLTSTVYSEAIDEILKDNETK